MHALRAVLTLTIFLLATALIALCVFVRIWTGSPALAEIAPAAPSAAFAVVSSAGQLRSEPVHYPQCPANLQTPEQMAAVIGGDPGDWTVPEGWWGAWTLRSAEFEHLVWPGFGFFDTANAGMRLQHDVDSAEASFHCEEPPTT